VTNGFRERKGFTLADYKERLEKLAKRANFSANYISLPCLVVSIVLMMAAIVSGNATLMSFNFIMVVFNGFGYWLNIKTRDRCQTVLNGVADVERLQKIKALNPNKG